MGDGWWKYFDFKSKLNLEQTHAYWIEECRKIIRRVMGGTEGEIFKTF